MADLPCASHINLNCGTFYYYFFLLIGLDLECEQQEGGGPATHWLSVLDDRCGILSRWNQDRVSLRQHTGLSSNQIVLLFIVGLSLVI